MLAGIGQSDLTGHIRNVIVTEIFVIFLLTNILMSDELILFLLKG